MTVTRTPRSTDAGPIWHALDREDVQRALGTGSAGLDTGEVQPRLERHGPNQLEEAPPPSDLALLLHQFRSPLIYILLVAAVVTLALREYLDSAVIAAVLLLNAGIGFVQERKAETSVRSLMQLLALHAHVIRDGREWEIDSRELVPGDLVLLQSGSRVPADVRLIATTALTIDESLLTGESVPTAKHSDKLPGEVAVADRLNMAFMGTTVAAGRGRGYVVATAAETELGRIAEGMRQQRDPETPLQRRLRRFARIIAVAVAISAAGAFALGLVLGESAQHMFMVAIALGVSAVPEGLPVVFTIALAVGVRRMARRNALIRQLPAVETIGSSTAIGSDKTGTLTENRMTTRRIWTGDGTFTLTAGGAGEAALSLGDDLVELAEFPAVYRALVAGVLTNEAAIHRTADTLDTSGDPTEGALLLAAARLGVEPEEVRDRFEVIAEVPFEPERQYSASFRSHEGEHWVFVKGAPERVAAMCSDLARADETVPLDHAAVHDAATQLAAEGLRVLAMAARRLTALPAEPDAPLGGLTFLGMQGMVDPPRAGVHEAITGCKEAGIRVVMITGDHAATARAIAADLGIAPADAPVLGGTDLQRLDDDELIRHITEVSVYARVAPEDKLRVVQALQRHGEIVAVTGDGVNDAPALKAAEIGVAMGRSGTDVAREAADMVLADDNFVSLYAAVEQGRITFDNLRKATFFLVSTGAAEVMTILVALALGWPLVFLPAQLLWLNLVTNGLQDVALAFEPGERDVLRRPPRRPQSGILSALLWERTLVTGVAMAAGTLVLFNWALSEWGSVSRAQTVAVTTMVLFQAFHAGNARSERISVFKLPVTSNPFLLLAVTGALLVHAAALWLPATQFVLRFEPFPASAWPRIVAVAVSVVVVNELHKLLRRGRGDNGTPLVRRGSVQR